MASAAPLCAAACASKSDSPAGSGTGGATTGGAGGSGGSGAGLGGGAGASGGAATGGGAGLAAGGSAGLGSGGTAGAAGQGAGQGGSAAGASGAGSGAVAGEGGDAGEGGGMNDDPPVLERPVREELSCEVTAPLASLGFGWSDGELAVTPSGAFLAWTEPSVSAAPDAAVIASIDATAALGTVRSIATYTGAVTSRPRLAASPRGMTVAWSESVAQMSALRVAELDAMGAVTKPPETIAGLAERLTAPELAPTADGNALLFVNSAVDYSSSRLRFALLDADAAVVGNVSDLRTSENAPRTGPLVAIPGGFAAMFTTDGIEVETSLAFLDASGNLQGDPVVLGSSRPNLGQSLLVRGDELLVAFGSEDGSYDDASLAGYVALARFDLTTRALAAPVVRVQTPTLGQETVNPVLFARGQDVGLLWSRGSIIYICGGCMPDNHLELVVMDGDDFTPLTPLVTVPNNEPMGGFIRPMIAPLGEHVVIVATLQFHIAGAAAAGALRCSALP